MGDLRHIAERCLLPTPVAGLERRCQRIALLEEENRRLTEALHHSDMQLREVQRLAHMGYWDWDIAMDLITWSAQLDELLGPAIDGMGYTAFLNRIHPADRTRLAQRVQRAVRGRRTLSAEFRVLTLRGERERHVHCEATVTFDREGRPRRMHGTAQEITGRKRIEGRLRESARRLGQQTAHLERVNTELQQFIYVIAHDLKAPLRAIANLSAWLEEDLGPALGGPQRHTLDLLSERVKRMHSLLQALLKYAQAGGEVQVTTVDSGRLVRELLEGIAVPADFNIEIAPDLPLLVTDRIGLGQVLANLIGNAIDHHPRRNGRVRIGATRQRHHYLFTVSDDGKGISPEYHEKIFELFQTLEPRDRAGRPGIGLSLVRKLTQGIGGRVEVESTPGVGSTFRVYWPR